MSKQPIKTTTHKGTLYVRRFERTHSGRLKVVLCEASRDKGYQNAKSKTLRAAEIFSSAIGE